MCFSMGKNLRFFKPLTELSDFYALHASQFEDRIFEQDNTHVKTSARNYSIIKVIAAKMTLTKLAIA